ncbi:MAG: tetratricopeptide repeat protein [Candidatus Rokubacteria bacterium]|nr:tetratricopeptide repeat protein [Candidatus Rokubacteria bacterium]
MIDLDRMADRLPSVRTFLIAAAVVLAAVLVAGGGWYWYRASQREAARVYAAALAQAHTAPASQGTPEARDAAARSLESALQSHPSAPLADQAAYELGSLRHAAGQYASARAAYGIALARGSSPTLKTLARLGIGYAWEAERNLPRATETFQAVAADLKPTDAFYEQALLDLARVQELAGRKDDAVQTYRRLLKDVARSPRADEVRLRLASLGATP